MLREAKAATKQLCYGNWRPRACETEFTVRRAPDSVSNLGSLVCLQRVLSGLLAVAAGLELGQIAVIVALHLQVEHLALA